MATPQEIYQNSLILARHCLSCSNVFWANPSDLRRGFGKYCSRACFWESTRGAGGTPRKRRAFVVGRYNNSPKSIKNRRIELIKYLGGRCVRCQNDDMRVLELDHINGGGYMIRKRDGTNRHIRFLSNNPEEAKSIVQVLCANCNRIKKHENNENPNKGEK